MRSVEEQQARIRAAAVAPQPVRVAISQAHGLVCAEEVVSEHPLPGFDQAAVDGYAVRSVDVTEAGPDFKGQFGQPADFTLPVVGEIRAGSRQPARLQPKQAVRIETGAPMPTLADAVVPLGWTDSGRAKVKIYRSVRQGDYVRSAGDDVRLGDIAVAEGAVIGPAQVGLLAAVGRQRVLVRPRPRVAVVSVGAELVDIDRKPASGQVFDVNTYALAAAARDAGADVTRAGIAGSEVSEIRAAIESQVSRSEIIVISGAVGGTASDIVREALLDLGHMEIGRVAMHPGSVQGFGQLGDVKVPTFLLPSNPVSALVVFEVMIRPLIRLGLGKNNPMRRVVRAALINDVTSIEGRAGFIRGQLMRDREGNYVVRALGSGTMSNLLADLAEANCLIQVAPEATHVGAGEDVDVAFLAQRG